MSVRFVRSALAAALLCLGCASVPSQAGSINGNQQVLVCDPANPSNCIKPAADGSIAVTGSGGGSGDASAANQTAVQANAGSDASKATAVQGITGGKAVAVSATSLPLPSGAATAALQPTNAAQGSTTSGQTGPLMQAGVTTAAPTYTTGQTSPLSLTTSGGLRTSDAAVLAAVTGPIPAQSSNGVNIGGVEGLAASGSSVAGNPLLDGGRAATTAPTAVTDGQAVAKQMTAEGRTVVAPYAIKELMVRGTTTSTDTSAHTIIASAGGSLKNYITGLQCGRTDAGATAIVLTLSDAASTVVILPSGGATNIVFPIPLATAAATAFQFTSGTGVSTVYCSAQGYTGL